MSLFDTISKGVSSLFDGDVGGAVDAISDSSLDSWISAGNSAFAAVGHAQKADEEQAKKDRQLLDQLFFKSNEMPTNQSFKNNSRSVPYGAQNYAANPQDIERSWQQYLRGVVDYSPVVPGEKYSKGAM